MSQRTKFLLLLSLFLLPTIASFIVFYLFPPKRTTNYGELLSPIVTLPHAGARQETAPAALRGKWLMLTRDSGACAEACRKKLYAMRQARLVLGREQDRVVRVVLVDDGVPPSAELQATYEGTIWITDKSHPWLAHLPVASDADARAHIYGVDTLGNVFIRYSADPDIRQLSNDFKKVLKASQIG
jgi:hypothetical protein